MNNQSRDAFFTTQLNMNDIKIKFQFNNTAATILFLLFLCRPVLSDPEFTSEAVTLEATVGDDVSFKCSISNRSTYFISWLQRENIMFANDIAIIPDDRFSVTESPDKTTVIFSISGIELRDENDYVCQIGTQPAKNQRNRLIVTVPPSIKRVGPSVVASTVDKTVQLSCKADGKPEPVVVWTRKDDSDPDGTIVGTGQTIAIPNVTPVDAGTYLCTASNGVNTPATHNITLTLNYAPIINQLNQVVTSARGLAVELRCTFYSNPPANVTWYKDDQPLPGYSHVESKGHNHTAVYKLTSLQANDFVDYVCVVKNDQGSASKTFKLTGIAEKPVIISDKKGRYSSVFDLLWTVTSQEPIELFEILIQKINSSGSFDEWDQINASVSISGNDYSYTLQGLYSDTPYAVKMRAKNHFGWSNFSDVIIITTNKSGFTPAPLTSTSYNHRTVLPNSYNAESVGVKNAAVQFTWISTFVNVLLSFKRAY